MAKGMIPGPRGLEPAEGEVSEGRPASPEEQKMYNEFVSVATIAMSKEKMLDRLVQMMSAEKSPAVGVGKFAAGVAHRAYMSAKEKGVDLTGDVILNGGAEILGAAIEYAEATGVPKFDEEAETTAMSIASDEFRLALQKSGDLDEKAVQEDLEVFRQAEQSPEAQKVLQALQAEQNGGQALPENLGGM